MANIGQTYKLISMVEPHKVSPLFQFDYCSSFLSLGSCFSEAIGNRLSSLGFDIMVNPFGTLYNPLSLAKALNYLGNPDFSFTFKDLTSDRNRYISLMHHSCFSSDSAEDLLNSINQELLIGQKQLSKATHLLLTLGSSFVYTLRSSGEVVANCHKLSPSHFICSLVSLEELCDSFQKSLIPLFDRHPLLRIILTVSPIRYLGYGAQESGRSKARLLLLCEHLEKIFPKNIFYFPSYEIQMDELRDYRFYKEDLVHPTPLAEEIIFDRFLSTWLIPKEKETLRILKKFRSLLQHHPVSEEGKQIHIQQIESWIKKYQTILPSQALIRMRNSIA